MAPNKKHSHVRTPLKTIDCGMLREIRYAKLCGLIIPGVERVVLYLDFYDCNMYCIFFSCKDNVFTIDFWWCKENVFSALHCYFQHYIVISSVSMFRSVVHIYKHGCMCV